MNKCCVTWLLHRCVALSYALVITLLGVAAAPQPAWAAGPPTLPISQFPLTVAQPAHPQVLLAIGNSESMDGNLSGAIMTGSGSLGAGVALLQNSSSPANYTIPVGFTPPLNPGAGGVAPYTVNSGGTLVDNSPSRLNVAKAGIAAILNAYMAVADFGLLDYQTTNVTLYSTWVYHMSPVGGGFTFTDTPVAGRRYVDNPCRGYSLLAAGNAVLANCAAIAASGKVGVNLAVARYMEVSASSDDPLINDVLYAGGGISPVCLVYGGPVPATPYPPNYTLATYNISPGLIWESYSNQVNSCARTTTPTNAGFIGYTPQEIYVMRGWAYGASQDFTTGNVVVPMQTSGAVPTAGSVSAAIGSFAPFLAPETNSAGTPEIKASAGQSALPGLLAGAQDYYKERSPPSSNGCAPNRYVVLLTDGLPTLDLDGRSWPPPGTTAAAGYGMTVAFNADGTLNASGTNDQAMTDTINRLASLASAGIKTYIIGLGAGVDPAKNPVAANALTAMALAGGTGSYFPAYSATDLTNDMQIILAKILAQTAATSSAAVNSTGINYKSVAFQGQFTTSDTYQDWTGNLLAFKINAANGTVNTAAPLWSAVAKLDAQDASSGRVISTWDPVANRGIPFRWTGGTPVTGIGATTALGSALSTFPGDSNGQHVLDYLRGSNVLEQRNGGQFRNRAHRLGDIIDSQPLYLAGPTGPWMQASYSSFVAAHANRSPVIYVGGNDGFLHAFDATTGNPSGHVSGQELFAYAPNGVFSNLVKLVSPYYNQQHAYFVDGSPTAQDVQFGNGSWHTVLVSGERAGGKSIFALDVTDPASLNTETALAANSLWEFTDGNMGYTFSTPVIASTAAGFAVFFGNGYNSPSGTPFLYALDPQTGAIKAKIDLCAAVPTACSSATANGLSSVVLANSAGSLAAPADVLYAGDLQGNIWRVNISSSSPASWTVTVLFKAQTSGGAAQPITSTPVVTLNPLFPTNTGLMVYVATGQFLGLADLANTQVQTVYGIYDGGGAPATALRRTDLVAQTMTSATTTTANGKTLTIRKLTRNVVRLPTAKGWYADLNLASGERVFNDPVLFNGTLQVVSYQPNVDPCSAGGMSYYMVFDYATGGATLLPQFDVNGDNLVNGGDLVGGATVAGFGIVGYASGVTALRGGGAGGQAYYSYTPPAVPPVPPTINNIAQATTIGRGAWQELRQ